MERQLQRIVYVFKNLETPPRYYTGLTSNLSERPTITIKTFILPARNEPDLAELPPEVRQDMQFVPVRALEEVLRVPLPPLSADKPT
ncbi:MAG: hypothetical protein FJW27_15740 [Acidimicrobiia bacterium]|nr:hypothetical protein [Acidimicrobiia bacterium]